MKNPGPLPLRSHIRQTSANPGPGRIWARPNLRLRHRNLELCSKNNISASFRNGILWFCPRCSQRVTAALSQCVQQSDFRPSLVETQATLGERNFNSLHFEMAADWWLRTPNPSSLLGVFVRRRSFPVLSPVSPE